jgi:uncharacterized membrane protein (DUF106 family)
MDVLARAVAWLNAAANVLGRSLLSPIGMLPGWLSATLVSAITGVLLLIVFKYTSNQRAIKRVRDGIKADLLALKLFKESASVALRAQGRIMLNAGKLLLLSIVPMLVMLVPVCLLVAQLALWYQARPLQVGEEAIVTLTLRNHVASPWPDVCLQPTSALEVMLGPVRVLSKHEICWNIKAQREGYHRLLFQVGQQQTEKELAIGDRFMRVSGRRPGDDWTDRLLNPGEAPYDRDSPIQSIAIRYPERSSWTSGTDWWMLYWFAVSMVAAFCFRRWLKVSI